MATIEGEDSEIHQNDDVENNNLQVMIAHVFD